ncbi:cytochrome P450 [Streptomyces sp. NPDC048483]|uniref:cytochrome P450 family protein n=1 Tax=Streptomyces sp. NPDC048483 TaxID=3154927 RepID=UPI0034489A85
MAHSLARPVLSIAPRSHDVDKENDALLAEGPIVPVTVPGEVPVWAVTRYELARRLLRDNRLSHSMENWDAWQRGEVSPTWPALLFLTGRNMINVDPPEHSRLRALVGQAFKVRPVEALRPRIAEITAGLLDELAARPAGAVVDLKEDFAVRLPITLFCDMFGITDPAVARRFKELTDVGVNTTASVEQVVAMGQEFQQLLGALVEEKRRSPGEDLTSALVAARDQEHGSLTDEELLSTLLLMVSGGHETTATLLVNAVHQLCTHPDQLAAARGDHRKWPAVVEESLRHRPPVKDLFFRFALEDLDIEGVTVRAGEPVMAALGAIGRDPQLHTDADLFDIDRARQAHLAFGYGVHHCIGAAVARAQGEIGLAALFDRFPALALADSTEPEPASTFIVDTPRRLLVTLT